MPLISTLAGASARAYGFLSGLGKFFIARYNAFFGVAQTAVDAEGNLYFASRTQTSAYSGLIAKFNPSGTQVLFQKSSNNIDWVTSLAIGTAGTIVMTAYDKTDQGALSIVTNQTFTDGNYRKLGGSGTTGRGGFSTSNLKSYHILNTDDSTVGLPAYVASYGTGGFISWQRQISNASVRIRFVDVTADGSGNSYVIGYTSDTPETTVNTLLLKYNSSGTLQFQKIFTTTQFIFPNTIFCDSSSNLYVGFDDGKVIKYNSSGSIQWQRKITTSITDLTVDSSGNVYAMSSNSIYKFQSNGTPDIRITLGPSFSLQHATIIDGSIFVTQNDSFLLYKLPLDGSLTGTYSVPGYGTVSYTTAFFTATTPTLELTDSTYTESASSLTDTAYTPNFEDISIPISTVNFG